eukprot:2901743-Rhodomonas_salina.1
MGAGRKPHQSREQKQLRADAVILRKCEEEWWMRGHLSAKNNAKLAQVSKWPGLQGVEAGDLNGVTYDQGAKRIADARKDRGEKDKQTVREQQRAEARRWMKQALKDFPGAGTYSAGIHTGKGQFPQVWSLRSHQRNQLCITAGEERRQSIRERILSRIQEAGYDPGALQDQNTACDTLK